MKNTYTLEIECGCPADNLPDVYKMTVISRRTIPVERILEVVKKYKTQKIYQEDLCQSLHREINACVILEGNHSGVNVVSECGSCTL